MSTMFRCIECGELWADNTRQNARRRLQQGHGNTDHGQDCSDLKSDIPASDHDDLRRAAFDFAHELVAIGSCANHVDTV
jgi:hypothetical protein